MKMAISSLDRRSLSGAYPNPRDSIYRNLIPLVPDNINLKKDTKALSKDRQATNSLTIRDCGMITPWSQDLDTTRLRIKRIKESLSAKNTKMLPYLMCLDLGYKIINIGV